VTGIGVMVEVGHGGRRRKFGWYLESVCGRESEYVNGAEVGCIDRRFDSVDEILDAGLAPHFDNGLFRWLGFDLALDAAWNFVG
jgi:hypothetical protein